MTEPIKKRDCSIDLTKKAYMSLRRMMFHNEIAPGSKIAYRDLAKKLDMSPTPVSNALKYLEFQGLVRKELNRGYYTEPISMKEIDEIYTFREVIEVSLLPDAISNLDDNGAQKLKLAFEATTITQNDTYISERVSKDIRFHVTLAELSHNRTQLRALKHLFDLLYLKYGGHVLFGRYLDPVAFSTHFSDSESCHEQIFNAVLAQKTNKAQHALAEHIRKVKGDVLKGLKRTFDNKEGDLF